MANTIFGNGMIKPRLWEIHCVYVPVPGEEGGEGSAKGSMPAFSRWGKN